MSGIVWQTPPSALIANIEAYGEKIQKVIASVGQIIAARAESYAKDTAPWTDRTGQARQGLTGLCEAAAGDLVTIYLYHQADHGKWLELANSGRYRVIMPTLQAMYGEVMRLIAAFMGGR